MLLKNKKMADNTVPEKYKLVLLGDTNVGKTSIFNLFINGKFEESKGSSIGVDFSTKNYKYKNKNYSITLFDTAGQERFRSIIQGYYHMGQGIFLVFDLTNNNSLNSIPTWIESIKENNEESKYIILGNKDDLKNKISDEEINSVLGQIKEKYIFIKTSSVKNQNINKAFEKMIDLIEGENNDQVQSEVLSSNSLNNNNKKKKDCCKIE